MKNLISILTIGICFALTSAVAADAAPRAKKAQKSARPTKKADALSTDVKFEDSTLHGQYQTPDEALAKVENEKGLQDLLGVRKHFKDRLSVATEQE